MEDNKDLQTGAGENQRMPIGMKKSEQVSSEDKKKEDDRGPEKPSDRPGKTGRSDSKEEGDRGPEKPGDRPGKTGGS